MKGTKLTTAVMFALIAMMAALCFGPWYKEVFSSVVISVVEVIALFLTFFAALAVYAKSKTADPNRRNWLLLGIGFLLYALVQSVLRYYQSLLLVPMPPFPSWADLFFVAYSPFAIWALFSFCRNAGRSGLSLGRPLVFWWPALAVLAVSLIVLPLLLTPVVRAGGTGVQIFLNIFYPTVGFVALAPCAVILRFGLKFRGGNVFWIWSTITAGYLLILSADILFAYVSMLEMSHVKQVLDFLYVTGYILLPRGILYQRNVLSF